MLIFIAEIHVSYYDAVYLSDWKNQFELENYMGYTLVIWSIPIAFTFTSFVKHTGFSDVSYNILAS